jgi:hypothetical protein
MITPLPDAPLPTDLPAVFNSKAFAMVSALETFIDELNAEIPTIDLAVPASEIALAAANYKGAWSALSGSLAIPASVSHLGAIWLLSESVANVAAEVPGTSAKWLTLTDYVKLTGNQTIAGVKTFSSDPVMGVSGLTGSIAAARILAALNATGSAPIYAPRAWVRFNGNTGAIVAAGNVTSVTRNGVGDYTIAFTTALPDANYAVMGSSNGSSGNFTSLAVHSSIAPTTTQVRVQVGSGAAAADATNISVCILR